MCIRDRRNPNLFDILKTFFQNVLNKYRNKIFFVREKTKKTKLIKNVKLTQQNEKINEKTKKLTNKKIPKIYTEITKN